MLTPWMLDHVAGLGSSAALPAAQLRLDPLHQHLDAERLGHVVVGPHREADHLVGLLGLGREHDDRDLAGALAGAQLAADLQPVQAGSIRSSRIRSGRRVWAFRSPSWPSWATMVS